MPYILAHESVYYDIRAFIQVAVRLRGPCTSTTLCGRVVEGHRKQYNYQLSTINCQLLYNLLFLSIVGTGLLNNDKQGQNGQFQLNRQKS